jgi:hypothetical protein
MVILYGVGLALALLIGGAIGLFLTVARYELVASRHRGYEWEAREIAASREFSVAPAMLRPVRPVGSAHDEVSAM